MILCANPLAQYQCHRAEIDEAVRKVLHSGRYIMGAELDALECEFADYIGTKYAIGVANGTDAIELALRALEIGPGDEVITVSHTAVATVAAIEATGATAVLVDVEVNFYTLDVTQLDEVLTPRTRAVVAVHLYGQAADMDSIAAFCTAKKLALIEDVSQAHGARWRGKRLGSFGNISCFSCYPTKNLGAMGDAGLITTDDASLSVRARMLREYGWRERYISEITGRNSRLDELQAAILRVKLRHLDKDNSKRRVNAERYTQRLAGVEVIVPSVRNESEHVFHLYVIRCSERDQMIKRLKESNIHAGIHYPNPIHRQQAYRGRLRTARSMRATESLSLEIASLPMYPELDTESVDLVVEAIKSFVSNSGTNQR